MKVIAKAPHPRLIALSLLYISLALAFSLTIPLSKAPDEYVHFLYARFLTDHARPPVNPQERQIAGYKSDQPPLYHALVAAATSWVDVSEPPSFKFTWSPHRRQLIDIVLPRAILVRTADETWPFAGLFLAWFVGRWVSVLLSAATVVMTYFIALELFPNQNWLALAAAGLLAFTPRYIFTGAVLSDDNLIGLLMAIFLWLIVRLVKEEPARAGSGRMLTMIAIGGVVGLALVTKYSVALVPLELAIIVIWLAKRRASLWPDGFINLLLSGLMIILIAGSWFGFIIRNFNQVDTLGPVLGIVNPLIAGDASDETSALISGYITGNPALAAEADPGAAEGNLWDWTRFFFEQLWDVPVFGAPRLYPAAVVLLPALALCGLAVWGWRRRWQRNQPQQRLWLSLLLLHSFMFIPIPLLRFIMTGQIHDTAQARHLLFPAAPALAILLAAGLVAVFPARQRRWVAVVAVGFTLSLAILHLYYYRFAFPAPLPVRTDSSLAALPEKQLDITFEAGLELKGYDWRLRGTEALDLRLYWQVSSAPADDYRTEISLRDSNGQLQSRWLSHPAGGRFPTRAWEAGDSVRDTFEIPLRGLPAGEYQAALRLLQWDDRPLFSSVGETVALTSFSLNTPTPVQAPELWQDGEPAADKPRYRYRASIPVLAPPGNKINLVDLNEQIYTPLADVGGLRLFMVDHTWPSGIYRVQLDGVETGLKLKVDNFEWDFSPPQMMHSVNANFNDEIRLLGYDLPVRRVEAGSGVPLVLHWQSLRRITKSYIIFDRLLDVEQQSWGGYDRLPKETYPTELWVPGEVVTDGFAVPVAADAPDGVYYIAVGLYDEADPAATSLPLVENSRQLETRHITIGPVKVGGPPAEVVVRHPAVDQLLNVNFGQIIRLVGYDLELDDQKLNLSLYWESLDRTTVDYTVFVHLLNEAGELVAQGDHPPAGGHYPTLLWDAGEIVRDSFELPLTELPTGRYQLIIGLYDRWSDQRLMITAPATAHPDRLILETVSR